MASRLHDILWYDVLYWILKSGPDWKKISETWGRTGGQWPQGGGGGPFDERWAGVGVRWAGSKAKIWILGGVPDKKGKKMGGIGIERARVEGLNPWGKGSGHKLTQLHKPACCVVPGAWCMCLEIDCPRCSAWVRWMLVSNDRVAVPSNT